MFIKKLCANAIEPMLNAAVHDCMPSWYKAFDDYGFLIFWDIFQLTVELQAQSVFQFFN